MRDAKQAARAYLDRIMIEQRLIGAQTADTSFELWGEVFSTPVMTPAFSHLGVYGEGRLSGLEEYALAMKELNAVNWIGMCENEVFRKVADTGARTIRIVKPYEDRGKTEDRILFAADAGALAVGMDIDHIFGSDGQYDVVQGERMTFRTAEQIGRLVSLTDLPFVVKGVLSVQDALLCKDAGVKGIVVSHHSGRLPYAVPPLMVLPDICEALKGSGIRVFVDCSIETGADVYKALALGADAASIGRSMLPDLKEKGTEGAKAYIRKVTQELAFIMGFTGAKSPDRITGDVLWDECTGKKLL